MYAVAWGGGSLIGPFLGGIIADVAGFQSTLFVAGVLILMKEFFGIGFAAGLSFQVLSLKLQVLTLLCLFWQ
jgi:MFS family permease